MYRLFYVSLCLAAVAAGGCERKTSIAGSVTYNAAPVENGYISFSPKGSGLGKLPRKSGSRCEASGARPKGSLAR